MMSFNRRALFALCSVTLLVAACSEGSPSANGGGDPSRPVSSAYWVYKVVATPNELSFPVGALVGARTEMQVLEFKGDPSDCVSVTYIMTREYNGSGFSYGTPETPCTRTIADAHSPVKERFGGPGAVILFSTQAVCRFKFGDPCPNAFPDDYSTAKYVITPV